MAAPSRARAREDIVRLVHSAVGVHRFAKDMTRVLDRAIGFDGASLLTVDPATLLPNGLVLREGVDPVLLPRLLDIELGEPDFNKFSTLARERTPAASLSMATNGDLDKSVRQRELRRPKGFDDELRVVCSDTTGTWGALTLLRESGRPRFAVREVHFVASLAPLLADGLRRAALLGDVATCDQRGVGVVVLGRHNAVEMATAEAVRWLTDLAAGDKPGAELPVAVLAVAARARRIVSDYQDDPDRQQRGSETVFARARVRATDGRWVTVRGSVLGDGPESSVAVLMEEVQPPELAPLIADVYGLTDRERRVTELVAQGHSTNDVGQRLHLSAYTVQDHLKSAFEKTGTSSRGELVARLFFDHYAPRLRTEKPD